MNGRYLLDTNIAIRLLNQELDLQPFRGSGLEAFLSLTVVGELYFGVEKSREPEVNRAKVERLIELCPILPFNHATAQWYATLKIALRRKGRPIPENDIWIAASAVQYGLTLATRDRHFEEVERLQTEAW